jgi:hypothetical protein
MRDWGFGKSDKRDPITRPKHYVQGKVEVLDAIMLLGLDPCAGNVLKYIARHTMKGGRDDLMKAKEYINLMLENYDEWYGTSERDQGKS